MCVCLCVRMSMSVDIFRFLALYLDRALIIFLCVYLLQCPHRASTAAATASVTVPRFCCYCFRDRATLLLLP